MDHMITAPQLSTEEVRRMERVISLLPKTAKNVLEIGARQGAMTRRLAELFENVTALDLQKPSFNIERVNPAQGDVQHLQFAANSFDCVVCTEVLEHVPDISSAAREITRVSRSHILIGVPYRQDRRDGRTTCVHCGKINPPYGHLHSFDETRITQLFTGLRVHPIEYVGENRERTNAVSTWLYDFARNPYGTYDQEEGCIYCGSKLETPPRGPLLRRVAAGLALRLYKVQYAFHRVQPTWMLVVFEKVDSKG